MMKKWLIVSNSYSNYSKWNLVKFGSTLLFLLIFFKNLFPSYIHLNTCNNCIWFCVRNFCWWGYSMQNMIHLKSHLLSGNTSRASNLSSFVPCKNVLTCLPSRFETLIALDSSVERFIKISRQNTPRDYKHWTSTHYTTSKQAQKLGVNDRFVHAYS